MNLDLKKNFVGKQGRNCTTKDLTEVLWALEI